MLNITRPGQPNNSPNNRSLNPNKKQNDESDKQADAENNKPKDRLFVQGQNDNKPNV